MALTGASGFIGSALLGALSENGWHIRALSRHPRKNSAAVEWLCGDLNDKDTLVQLVKGAVAVIHCAGAVRGKSAASFNHTNVEGTAKLVEASVQQSPQPRLLLISSLAARAPQLSWYATSKRRAEQSVIEQAHAMPWTVFRPTAVYGPGDKELRPLLNATRFGLLPAVGGSDIRFSLLHIKDLVGAVICWISATVPVKGVFELDDGTAGGYDWRSLAKIAEQVWQRPVRIISIPRVVLSMFANMNLYLSRLFRYEPMLTPGKVRELTHPDWICDNKPLAQALAWQPRIKLRDALQEAALVHA